MDELAHRITAISGGLTLDFSTGTWDKSLSESTTIVRNGVEVDDTAKFTVLVLENKASSMLATLHAEAVEVVKQYSLPVHHVQVLQSRATAHHFLIESQQEIGCPAGSDSIVSENFATAGSQEVTPPDLRVHPNAQSSAAVTVLLDGHNLSPEQAWAVANGSKIVVE